MSLWLLQLCNGYQRQVQWFLSLWLLELMLPQEPQQLEPVVLYYMTKDH